MRLINTGTGEFEEFSDLSTTPPYAILSHTWDSTGEQRYQEVIKIQDKYRRRSLARNILRIQLRSLSSIFHPNSGISEKVRRACEIARGDGYRYIWIDSSCINKDSSSELSEAINSMFDWYRGAQVCYAFLSDVPSPRRENVRVKGSQFRQSRWFKRGWTLQELIAPVTVVFLSHDWKTLGTRDALADVIHEITSIDHGILTQKKALSAESIAGRMRWAANRETTRVEDEAYSLLGIFEITMPTLYGEGRYAFRRLQEEILRRIPDQSLFAWGSQYIPFPMVPCEITVNLADTPTIFAPSPQSFTSSSRGLTIRATVELIKSFNLPVEEYTHTPYGIRTKLCLLPLKALNPKLGITCDTLPWYLVVLRSQHTDHPQRLLARLCYLNISQDNVEFLHAPDRIHLLEDGPTFTESSGIIIFTLSHHDLKRVMKQLQTKTVYLPYLKPSVPKRQVEQLAQGVDGSLILTLPTWVRDALLTRGYIITNEVQGPIEDNSHSFSFTLLHALLFSIHIQYHYMTIHSTMYTDPPAAVIEARVWILSPGEAAHQTNAAITCSPPYTSATWADCEQWAVTSPPHSLNLIADSRDKVTLMLGLDALAPSRYNIRIDVVPDRASEIGTSCTRIRPYHLEDVLDSNISHETFNLLLSGSVRRALKIQGYSANLDLVPSQGGFHSHSLTLSGGFDGHLKFVILVKYFHTLGPGCHFRGCQELVVVARVTLQSSISDNNSEAFQDGPHIAIWKDTNSHRGWEWSLEEKHVVLTTPTGTLLTLLLGFHFSWKSEYYLYVDIQPATTSQLEPPVPELLNPRGSVRAHWYELGEDPSTLTRWAHERISLILPGHVKRALEEQGFQVGFDEPKVDGGGEPGNSTISHVLTLRHIPAGIAINLEYSLRLITPISEPGSDAIEDRYAFLLADHRPDSDIPTTPPKESFKPCQQELTFHVSVRTPSSHSTPASAPTRVTIRSDGTTFTADWGSEDVQRTRRSKGPPDWPGWRRQLPSRDIIIPLSSGNELSLRLGFYLVWYSEYYLTVEIKLPDNLIEPGLSMGGTTSDWLRAIRGWYQELSKEYGRAQIRPVIAGHEEPLPEARSTLIAAAGLPVGSQEGTRGGDDPDSHLETEEPVASGSGT